MRDYDVDGYDDRERTDSEGGRCFVASWGHDPAQPDWPTIVD